MIVGQSWPGRRFVADPWHGLDCEQTRASVDQIDGAVERAHGKAGGSVQHPNVTKAAGGSLEATCPACDRGRPAIESSSGFPVGVACPLPVLKS